MKLLKFIEVLRFLLQIHAIAKIHWSTKTFAVYSTYVLQLLEFI